MQYVEVRKACYTDLAPLSRSLGHEDYFNERFERQKNDRGALFIAWLDGRPVGDVYLWLEPAEELEIRLFLPDAALLTHLEVLEPFRSGGIGTRIIEEVEAYVMRECEKRRVALAVRLDNHEAARLYRRLGYLDWGQGQLPCFADTIQRDGQRRRTVEYCYVLVKELRYDNFNADRILPSPPR